MDSSVNISQREKGKGCGSLGVSYARAFFFVFNETTTTFGGCEVEQQPRRMNIDGLGDGCTMVQNSLMLSHLITDFPMSLGVSV